MTYEVTPDNPEMVDEQLGAICKASKTPAEQLVEVGYVTAVHKDTHGRWNGITGKKFQDVP